MTSTVVTFVANVDSAREAALENAVSALSARAATVPHEPFSRLDGLHFASVVIFRTAGYPPLLVLESNFDGALDGYVDALVREAALDLDAILSCCDGYDAAGPEDRAEIARYLRNHAVHPAAYHVGNVGRSRDRVWRETALRETLTTQIDARLSAGERPRTQDECFVKVRRLAEETGNSAWIDEPHARQTLAQRVVPRLRLYGVGAVALVAAWLLWPWWVFALAAFVLALLYHEMRDRPMPPSDLDPTYVQHLAGFEDHRVQNHLASLTVVKAGLFRRLTLRSVLWAVNLLARVSTHGSLSGIPSIHYAHWALVDGGRRLLFLSNFDGSWESYLDDFIDKAASGLTAVWSNTEGFPRTRFLVKGGARDGVAFKAFARSQQTPSALWYSAYPDLTVAQIDRQSLLREGLASKPPETAAMSEWLKCC